MSKFQIPLGRLLDTEPLSVVDIGSNSVRLVVYEGAKRSPAVIFNEKILCGLGKSLDANGALGQENMAQAFEALRRYRAVSRQLGSNMIHAIATAAARDASNGDEFIKTSEGILGETIHLLSGEEEARLAATGVISGNMDADGLIADMGGGSIEISNVFKQDIHELVSLPIGALRLMEASEGNVEQAEKIVEDQLKKVEWLKKGRERRLYLVGGTWRALAKLHMIYTSYPLRFIDNYTLDVSQAVDFINFVKQPSATETLPYEEISKGRRESVVYGACALKELIKKIKPSKVIFSGYGVREGLLYNLLPEQERLKDPLYAACYDLAILRARSPQNAEELCSWTDKLFESLDANESKQEKNLRYAICLLSDIAWRIHPEYRGRHSISMIAQSAFAGVSHMDRIYIALGVFFRHEGRHRNRKLPEISALLDEKRIEKARILGLAIRLANIISANMPGILHNTPLVRDKSGKLILTLPEPYQVLDGERVVRRLANLAQLLKLDSKIQQNADSS